MRRTISIKRDDTRCHSEYLTRALHPASRAKTIRIALRTIRKSKLKFDAIAVRGSSGLLIGPIIADRLKKPLMMVRKQGDGSHSNTMVEGFRPANKNKVFKYLIVDDTICTGTTLIELQKEVLKEMPTARLSGVYVYNWGELFEAGGQSWHVDPVKFQIEQALPKTVDPLLARPAGLEDNIIKSLAPSFVYVEEATKLQTVTLTNASRYLQRLDGFCPCSKDEVNALLNVDVLTSLPLEVLEQVEARLTSRIRIQPDKNYVALLPERCESIPIVKND